MRRILTYILTCFLACAPMVHAADIADATPWVSYTATSGQTVFPYSFVIFDDDDLVVYQNGNKLTKTSHYTVSGVGDEDGGNVVLLTGATTDDVIVIASEPNQERTSQYTGSERGFTKELLDDDLNRIVAQIQRNRLASMRSPQHTYTQWRGTQMTLPDPDVTKVLGWAATGQLANVDPDAVGTGADALNSVIPGGTRTVATMQDYLAHNACHNIQDYGAIPDDSGDDAAAIQLAIDAAQADTVGGVVCMPPGVYDIDSGLTVANSTNEVDVSILGAGAPFTSLNYRGTGGTALTIAGTATGQNKALYLADFTVENDPSGTGAIGIDGNFITFSPTFARLIVRQFTDKNLDLTNFENGLLEQVRVEMGPRTTPTNNNLSKYGVFLDNANAVLLEGVQIHGYGQSSTTNADDDAFGIYVIDSDGIVANGITIEGNADPLQLDSCWYDAGGCEDVGASCASNADCTDGCTGATPAVGERGYGGNIIHGYFERCRTAINLAGNSTRDAQNYDIRGKIGGDIVDGIKMDYADSINVERMLLQIDPSVGVSAITTTTNTSNVYIGDNYYRGLSPPVITRGDTSATNPNHGLYWGTPVEALADTRVNGASGSVTTYTGAKVSGDPRLPVSSIFKVKIVFNASGTVPASNSEFMYVMLRPKDGSADDECRIYVYPDMITGITTGTTMRWYGQCHVKAKQNTGEYEYQVFETGTGWDVNVEILEIARQYG